MKLKDTHSDTIKIVVNDESKVDTTSDVTSVKENSTDSENIQNSEDNSETKETENIEENKEAEEVKNEFIDIDKIKAEVAEKDKRIDELEERLQKLYADYDNFRKRKEAEAESAKKYAAEKIVSELLPIVDNFERAVDASANYDSLKEGVVMIHRQIWEILGKVGLSAIDSIGNIFDPALHQAVFCEKKEDLDDDVVIAELLKGYKLHDKVIRPSMVIVNKK